jgi:hypothetical protein
MTKAHRFSGGYIALIVSSAVLVGALIATVVALSVIYIPQLNEINSSQRRQLEELNTTLLMVVSTQEKLIMETSTNVTLEETGTCRIQGSVLTLNYEFYSFITHDNLTYYFIKILPMSAPYQLTGPSFGFQDCTGPKIFAQYFGSIAVIRSFDPNQIAAIQLSDPTAYVSTYVFYYGQYIQWDIPASQLITFGTLQIIKPLIFQVPIEPRFFSFLPPGLEK